MLILIVKILFSGHNAKDCTYSLMEEGSKKILTLKTINKLETENKSSNMEYEGFMQGMKELEDMKLTIVELVTDSHSKITSKLGKL